MNKLIAMAFTLVVCVSLPAFAQGEKLTPDEVRTNGIFRKLIGALGEEANGVLTISFTRDARPSAQFGGRCFNEETGAFQNGVVFISSGMIVLDDGKDFPSVAWFTLAHELSHWKQVREGITCKEVQAMRNVPGSSRLMELEADVEAVRLLNQLGFDGATIAEDAINAFCERMGKCAHVNTNTHPSLPERLANIWAIE